MTTLTEKAMLVSVRISRWQASITDRAITEKVIRDAGAHDGAGRFNKRLVAAERLDKLRELGKGARYHHYENTLPWLDNGARILPAASYFDYMQRQNAFKAQFDTAVAQFLTEYPDVITEAKKALGTMFKASDYPSISDMQRKFAYAIDVMPLPEAEDFRIALGDMEEKRVREQLEARLGEAAQGCVRDVWERIAKHVGHMTERLKAYHVDDDGKVQNTFRDSLVENIRELVDILPALNVTNSNSLEVIRQRLSEELLEVSAPELRDDAKKRRAVAKKAEAILKDVSDFMA
jgi:hypothetical protein